MHMCILTVSDHSIVPLSRQYVVHTPNCHTQAPQWAVQHFITTTTTNTKHIMDFNMYVYTLNKVAI